MSTFPLFYLFITFIFITTRTLCEPEIPDIFDIFKSSGNKTVGYKIVWEINDITGFNSTTSGNIGNSYSVTEYYDIENKRGRLDIIRANGVNGTFIYDETTNETFHLNEGKCTLGNINERPDFLKKFLDDFWFVYYPNDRNILGPSALLRLIKTLSEHTGDPRGYPLFQFVQNTNSLNDSRYLNGNSWKFNFFVNGINGVIGWIFTDPSSLNPNPYGYQNMASPVWVAVYKNGYMQKRYEVALFTPYTNNTKNLIKSIQIPLGLGCGRNLSAIANAPVPPLLNSGFSYDMKLEIVMQPSWVWTGNDVNPSNLVDNGRITYDDTAKLMAWRYDGFNVSGDISKNHYYSEDYNEYETGGFYYEDVTINTGDNSVTDDKTLKGNFSLTLPTRAVWDMKSGVVYIIDDIYGSCTIKQKKTNDFLVSINFKSGYKIPINTPELIQSDGFLYMGQFVERGIPVLVYEKRIEKMLIGYGNKNMVTRTVVITHYFETDNYKEPYVGNNMLIRIGISILYPNRLNMSYTKIWSATININGFTVNVGSKDVWSHVKQKVFNVKSCYLKSGLSKWFQLGFPITTLQYAKMFEQADTIDRQILNYLYTANDLSISPTRIPTSLIGWSSNTLYFSALMLERAPFSIDFHMISVGQQRLKNSYKSYLVKSFQECSGDCLDNIDMDCNYFSICDNFMCILSRDSLTNKPQMITSMNCTTYQRNSKGSQMLTMNMLLSKIESKVQSALSYTKQNLNLTLHLKNSNTQAVEMINITAVQFKTGFNFGQKNTLNEEITLNNDRYTLKSVTHYIISNNDKRLTLVQSNGFLNCQQKCDDFKSNTCHSFSYCTTNEECILSTMHSLQLFNSTNNNTYTQRSDCALLYRTYSSEYDRFSPFEITRPKTASKQLLTLSKEECAIACSTEKNFRCRSFDRCYNSTDPSADLKINCYLHTTHYLENLKNQSIILNLDPLIHCGHYSRKYASDFNVKTNMRYAYVDGRDRIRMTGLTVEQCAHECVETESKRKCLGFSYCEGRLLKNRTKPQPVCVLSPTNDENNTVYFVNDPKCELYFNGDLNFQLKPAENQSQKSSSGRYSSGAGVGVGIFMLLLGASIGIICVFFYEKRKARNNV